MEERPTVFVVDDDPAVRDSVAAMIEAKGMAVQTFHSAEDFLRRADRSHLGCVVTDVRMGPMCGLSLLERIRAERVTMPVIVITGYGSVRMAVEAMRQGAVTFLEKPCREDQLWAAVISSVEWHRDQRFRQDHKAELNARLTRLTQSEQEVLQRLIAGKPNKVIASEMQIGLRTAELRRATIMKKMEARSLAEVVRLALEAAETLPEEESPISGELYAVQELVAPMG